MRRLVIRGGEVVNSGSRFVADVLAVDGRIAQIGGPMPAESDVVTLDASGKLMLPGGIDMHVHLTPAFAPAGVGPGGIPLNGETAAGEVEDRWADDFGSGSRAAAAGGITTVGNMTFPHLDETLSDAIVRTADEARRQSVIDFVLHPVALSATGVEDQLTDLREVGCRTLKMFMMMPEFDQQACAFVSLISAAGHLGMVSMIHCEDASVVSYATKELISEGRSHPRYYGEARPIAAENLAVARATACAEVTGSAVYLVHVSSGAALDVVRASRSRGASVYVETRPIYLMFDESVLEGPEGALYVGNPPPRSRENVEALWRGLEDSTIDTCCSDHAPAPKAEKLGVDRDLTNVAPGLAELDTMLPILYSEGVVNRRLSLERFVEISSTNSAKIFGIYPQKGSIAVGSDADITLWDPLTEWTFYEKDAQSSSDFNVYNGSRLTGKIITTVCRGEVVFDQDCVVGEPGWGRLVTSG